jgi:hypothetical protein
MCDKMAKREYDEFYKTNSEIIKGRLEAFIKKLDHEMNILKDKHSKENEFIIKQRDDALQVLIQKYKNRRNDIVSKQNNEKYIIENCCIQRYASKIAYNYSLNIV